MSKKKSNSIPVVTPFEVYEFITNAFYCKQVPYISGPPGIGKSHIVHQVAQDANAKLIDLRLSQVLAEDLTGLPERDTERGKAVYLPFDTFPLEGDEIPDGYKGWVLLLDELSSATEEVLAAAYSLIHDRMIGGRKLHPKCLVVAAGNRSTDSAIARELPDTLVTRMLPCTMDVSSKDWLLWAQKNPNSNESVIDFIKKNPTMLYAPVKAEESAELETYPTPRGWEKVFAHINMHEMMNSKTEEETDSAGVPTGETKKNNAPINDSIFYMMSAAIGAPTARTFRETYNENIKLPYPWEIAQSPSSTRIPTTQVAKIKLMADLANYFVESDTQSRENVLIYVNRISGEFAESFLNDIKQKLGSTVSDKRLLEQIGSRLNIDPLLGTVAK